MSSAGHVLDMIKRMKQNEALKNVRKAKTVSLRVILLFLAILIKINILGQKKEKGHDYMHIKSTVGFLYFFNDKNTSSLLENQYGYSISLGPHLRNNWYFNITADFSNATLKKPLFIDNFQFSSKEKFFFKNLGVNICYCFYFSEQFSIEPYSGIIQTSFSIESENDGEKDYYKTGVPLGFSLNYYFKFTESSKTIFALYFNNKFSYVNMNKLNYNFGNLSYMVEFGFAFKRMPRKID